MGNLFANKLTPKEKLNVEEQQQNYFKKVEPLRLQALGVCKKWTNSTCQETADILKMAQKYAKLRAIWKHMGCWKFTDRELEKDHAILELYRKENIHFWHRLAIVEPHLLPHVEYPGVMEKRSFCSFHWAIYMTNNRCAEKVGTEGGEPKTFGIVLKTLDPKTQAEMKEFQDVFWKEFPVMQKEAMTFD